MIQATVKFERKNIIIVVAKEDTEETFSLVGKVLCNRHSTYDIKLISNNECSVIKIVANGLSKNEFLELYSTIHMQLNS